MKYRNPIISGYNPDPSICRVGEDYYIVNSSFEFYPGVPVYHSRNLVNWELEGYCLTEESQLDLHGCRPSGGIYAPTIRYHQGTFFMTTTNTSGKGNFIVHTSDMKKDGHSLPGWTRGGLTRLCCLTMTELCILHPPAWTAKETREFFSAR